MMNCKRLHSLVTDFFDDALGAIEQARFKLHMIICPSCARHVRKMEQLVSALGNLPQDSATPPEMLERFEKACCPSDISKKM